MLRPCTALTASGFVRERLDTQGRASSAAIAIRPIGEEAASPEPIFDQVGVNIVVDQMTRRCNLGARRLIRQVAARVGGCGIKLHSLKRQIIGIGQGMPFGVSRACQSLGANDQR